MVGVLHTLTSKYTFHICRHTILPIPSLVPRLFPEYKTSTVSTSFPISSLCFSFTPPLPFSLSPSLLPPLLSLFLSPLLPPFLSVYPPFFPPFLLPPSILLLVLFLSFLGREYQKLDILLFHEVLDHIARIDRVLTSPGGSLLLSGRSGVGRHTAVSLVAHMHHVEIITPHVSRNYQLKQFKNDLKNVS